MRHLFLAGITGHPEALDPELTSALQNVSEVVRKFVDNNPTAWAPLICQVIHHAVYMKHCLQTVLSGNKRILQAVCLRRVIYN